MKKGKKMNNSKDNAPDIEKTEAPAAADEEVNASAEEAQQAEEHDAPTQEEWASALKQAVGERDSFKEALMRSQAEFQNFRKRNSTVRTDAFDDGCRETIYSILPVIDNLELALMHASAQGEEGALVEGVRMTLRLLLDTLAKSGLEEVPALNEKFDPELHNAVQRAPGGEADTICEVFQKGYRVKDKMIRYAMVKVSSGEA